MQQVRSKLTMSESDIHSLEQEKDSLHRKVELLERAIESPNSQKILRRILERCVNVCYQYSIVLLCVC